MRRSRGRKINSKRGGFSVTGSQSNRPVLRGYRSSLSRAFVISIWPKAFFLYSTLSFLFFFFLFAYPLLDSSTAVLTPISPRSICCFAKNCGPPGRVLGIAQEKLNYSGRCNHRDVVCRVCNLLENEWNRNGASVLFDLQDTRNPFQFFVILNTRFSSRRAKKEAVNDLAA